MTWLSMSSHSSVDRASFQCLGSHRFNFCCELRFFFVPNSRHVDQFTFHISLITKLKNSPSSVKMFLSSRQAGYSNRQQRPKLQGPPEESSRSKWQILHCRRPNGRLPAHFDWAVHHLYSLITLMMTSTVLILAVCRTPVI